VRWLTYRVRYHQVVPTIEGAVGDGWELRHVTDDGGWYTLFFERLSSEPAPRKRGR